MGRTKGSMRPFAVSAPGKVIVHGEHSVVHGKAAIAAAISLRSNLLVTESPGPDPQWILDFPDVGLYQSWPVDALPWDAFAHPDRVKRYDERVTVLDDELVQHHLQPLLDKVTAQAAEGAKGVHRSACFAFLYALLTLGSKEEYPKTYRLTSKIPIASGLGSSASISVCLATAILYHQGHIKLPNADWSEAEAERTLEIINNWAFVGEICIHGTPSGVDNTIATRGKAVLYKRTEPSKPPTIAPIKRFPVLPLLVANTRQPRSTAVEVAKVRALQASQPAVVDLILDAMDKLSEAAHALLASPEFHPGSEESLTKLGELIQVNHGLLVSLGVSHPKLERIREIADSASAGWTKLTGAGGGGCAFTLLRPGLSGQKLAELERGLEREGFGRHETDLGGPGVGIMVDGRVEMVESGEVEGQWLYWGPE